ncbi:folylpolyglutamate synthase/dihydrofolate synthase family protein [Neobacillus sp. OS1-32]|uniref:tetrahydrofolate synthase n=1 Tax=Neobacillus paridis TaxID=2803862 RepID=A0ABS1TQE8_9BACI|nr:MULTISPECIES: folylpolyglutamate synthase/dihydrofolate synthase family protein [Neobacillus]MBL4952481.1 bifunctional folylpolyglutamate synthase/dihydrofolate synthase [Neobacillus paridis]WML31993.1 folylpolyglutamate synthase/dihydrofolate synthase family protein [Neobacillus sp. OS1-32]
MEEKFNEAMNYIRSREQFGSRPGLFRIRYLLDQLGNPQDDVKFVHIAGTNGKGSTVTYLKELFMNSGFKVGTYTSPYIERFNERICINGRHIPDEDIVYLINVLRPIVDKMDKTEDLFGLTEFELVTAMMFYYFHEKKVDVAVIEVGLGGLLDSTNVGHPLVSGITTIGLDHMQILGQTIEQIAEQKAGIIKQNGTVVTGNLPENALHVIEKKVRSTGAKIYRYNKEYYVDYIMSKQLTNEYFSFNNAGHSFPILSTSMIGSHQVENAGTALQMYLLYMEKCQLSVEPKIVAESLNNAFIPGRMEILSERPLVIVDGAHNVPGMERLHDNLQGMLLNRSAESKLFILFSAIHTKDVSGMIRLLEDIKQAEITITSFEYDSALSAVEIARHCHRKIAVINNWERAISELLDQMTNDDFLIITGSLYFISTVRQKVRRLLRRENEIVGFY